MSAFASGWEWMLFAHLEQWKGVWVGAEKHVESAGSSRGVGWQPAGFWVYDERAAIGCGPVFVFGELLVRWLFCCTLGM